MIHCEFLAPVTLNSFQGLSCSKPRARMDKWTLERQSPKVKQVQGDVVGGSG